jgi:hypothetical protein
MWLYKTAAILILCTASLCALNADLGVRVSTNIIEELESAYVMPDTFVMDTIQTPYTGLGIDFYITPYKNFTIRTNIADLRFLHDGGIEFLIFSGAGADLSYAFQLKKFYPYVSFGLTYRRMRALTWHNYRAGFGLAYQLTEKFKPYFEIQVWDRNTKSERGIDWWGSSTSEMTGLAKIHLGTTFNLTD